MPVVASSPPPESRAPDGDGALTRFAWLSIAAAVATIALKLGAWWLTGSVGLLSDALESGVNLIAAVLTLLMLGLAARAPDEDHAYGYGKAENFGSGAEGAMILVAAGLIAWTAIERLRAPAPIDEAWLGLGVSVGASTINLVVARILLAAGRRHRSIALEADGHHLMTDVWTSAGVVVGVAAVALTGWQRLDPLIALAVAANIVWTGVRIVRTSALGLLGARRRADRLPGAGGAGRRRAGGAPGQRARRDLRGVPPRVRGAAGVPRAVLGLSRAVLVGAAARSGGDTVAHQVDDRSSCCDRLDAAAVVIGWSMGVQVNFELWRPTPERVAGHPRDQRHQRSAVPDDPRHGVPREGHPVGDQPDAGPGRAGRQGRRQGRGLGRADRRDAALRHGVGDARRRRVPRRRGGFRTLDWRIYGDLLERLNQHDAEDVLPTITVPTAIVTGDKDVLTPPATAERLVARSPARGCGSSPAARTTRRSSTRRSSRTSCTGCLRASPAGS
jgi:cation diffusion facilitator family transporter